MKSAMLLFVPVLYLGCGPLSAEVTPSPALVGREVWVLPGTEFRVGKQVVSTLQPSEFGSYTVEKVQGEFLTVKGRQGWIYVKDTVFEQAAGRRTMLFKIAHRCGKWEQGKTSTAADDVWITGNWLNDEAMLIDAPVSCQTQNVRTCMGPANCQFAFYEIEVDAEGNVKQDTNGKAAYQKLLMVSDAKEFAWVSCPVGADNDCPATADECRILNQADGVAFPKTSIHGRVFTAKSQSN